MEKLIVTNLNFKYDGKLIFENYNLELNSQKIYAFSGMSGIGKSTLAKLIAGHLSPNSGEIFINQSKVLKPNREVFIVHQEDDLFPWQNVVQQLNFVAKRMNSSADTENLLKVFKLYEVKNLFPNQLSGGMKKRLALARAEIVAPKVLILDETFSSLDQEILDSILSEMIPIWKKRNMIVILISHQLDTLKKYVDEVIQL
jgi:NitT/TauT family transport system ATP-binding protein